MSVPLRIAQPAARPRASFARLSINGRPISVSVGVLIPALLFGGIVLVAVLAPRLAPFPADQAALGDSLLAPSWMDGGRADHLLGTDRQGRDVLSQLMFGARLSLTLAITGIALGAVLGTAVGLVAGYYGGRVDRVASQLMELTMALPQVLVALVLAALFGAGVMNVVIVMMLLLWARFARQVRAETRLIRVLEYIDMARLAGLSDGRIMLRHVLPGVVNTLIVLITLQLGAMVTLESSLSFLGVGVPPDQASWGAMISNGFTFLVVGRWWVSAFPALAISVTVLSVNLLGDWLRDALDPRLRNV